MDLMPTELPTRLARGPLSRAAVRAAARQSLAGSEALVWRGRAGLAGPSVAYVREHLADVKAWLAAGRRLRVWTVDEREDAEFLLAQECRSSPPTVRRTCCAGSASGPPRVGSGCPPGPEGAVPHAQTRPALRPRPRLWL